MPEAHHHHEEVAPERTTPQGTQAEGVEHGHENLDVNFRSLMLWFGGLAIGLAVTFIVATAAFEWWSSLAGGTEPLPSEVFARQQTPPLPRLLPNPTDFPGHPLPEPRVIMQAWREQQELLAQQYGLADPRTGLPALPKSAAAAVLAAAGGAAGRRAPASAPAATDALQQPMPSGASGGTATENRLR
jgi:hypothetical protein